MQDLAIHAEWTIVHEGGRHVPVRDLYTHVRDGLIVALSDRAPAAARLVEVEAGIVHPGFINLHNHTINAPLFRGIVDDLPRSAIGESKVYSMLMPMGGLAVTGLAADALHDLVALGLLEVLRSGVTTLLDQFRPRQRATLEHARDWGLRLYAAPYLFSPAPVIGNAQVARAATGSFEGNSGLTAFEQLHAEFDEGSGGMIRVILGPHAADSCGPDLLKRVDLIARERNLLVTTHLAQSQGEVDRIRERHGCLPADYMASVGLLREGVIFGHGVHLEDGELDRIAAAGATIAHCPTVFLRGGKAPHYARFARPGMCLGIGTDAERMDFYAQLRASGFASKQATGESRSATAADLFAAATTGGADALRRPDLGRISVGARADIVIVDALKPHLQPVNDPLRSLVWYASASDIHTVIIDGKVVIDAGQTPAIDRDRIIRRGAVATTQAWQLARDAGCFPAEADPQSHS